MREIFFVFTRDHYARELALDLRHIRGVTLGRQETQIVHTKGIFSQKLFTKKIFVQNVFDALVLLSLIWSKTFHKEILTSKI